VTIYITVLILTKLCNASIIFQVIWCLSTSCGFILPFMFLYIFIFNHPGTLLPLLFFLFTSLAHSYVHSMVSLKETSFLSPLSFLDFLPIESIKRVIRVYIDYF
jgi:hypothetical protein